MKVAPLQPESIVFDEVSIQVQYDDEKNCIVAPDFDFQDVEFDCVVSHSDENENSEGITSRLISVGVQINNISGKISPYKVDVKASGVFRWLDKQTDPTKRMNLVVVNGASLLYGAIREMVLNVTSRSVAGALTLPSFNFVDAAPSSATKAVALSEETLANTMVKPKTGRVSSTPE
jgi:preprotein translocase subunit SecB